MEIILKWLINEYCARVWKILGRLRIGSSDTHTHTHTTHTPHTQTHTHKHTQKHTHKHTHTPHTPHTHTHTTHTLHTHTHTHTHSAYFHCSIKCQFRTSLAAPSLHLVLIRKPLERQFGPKKEVSQTASCGGPQVLLFTDSVSMQNIKWTLLIPDAHLVLTSLVNGVRDRAC